MPKSPGPNFTTDRRNDPDLLWQQALADLQNGKAKRAEKTLRQLATEHPEAPGPRELLGLALLKQDKPKAALEAFKAALALGLENAGLHNNLALALTALERHEEAAVASQRATELEPTRAELQANLGNRLKAIGQIEAAILAYRRALELKPQLGSARVSLGSAHASLGQGEAALECFRSALRHNPDHINAFYHLALTAKAGAGGVDPATLARFSARRDDRTLTANDRILLESALGHLAEQQQRYDEAFAHYRTFNEAAKALRAERDKPYSRKHHSRFVEAMIAAFPDRASLAPAERDAPGPRPIFIVGLPRSGTTLVEQILAGHSAIAAGGERPELPQLVAAIANYPAGLAKTAPETLADLGANYRAVLRRLQSDAPSVTDKLPTNFLHLGLITRLFPDAAVIHCRRDPLDCCFSCYAQNFSQDQAFANDLADLGHYYNDYRRLMAHWQRILPRPTIELEYEQLVAEPEPMIRSVLAALGLEWQDACLEFQVSANPVQTASQWQVRQKINSRSIGRWRRFEAHLAPLIEIIGEADA